MFFINFKVSFMYNRYYDNLRLLFDSFHLLRFARCSFLINVVLVSISSIVRFGIHIRSSSGILFWFIISKSIIEFSFLNFIDLFLSISILGLPASLLKYNSLTFRLINCTFQCCTVYQVCLLKTKLSCSSNTLFSSLNTIFYHFVCFGE